MVIPAALHHDLHVGSVETIEICVIFFFQVHFLVFFFGGGTGESSHLGGAGFVQEWFLHEFGQYQAESTGAFLSPEKNGGAGPRGSFFFFFSGVNFCFFLVIKTSGFWDIFFSG